MPEFASLHSYQLFEQSVKTKARFVHEDAVREFLKIVLETAERRLKPLAKDELLFRARRGGTKTKVYFATGADEYEEVEVENGAPLSSEDMIPKAELVGAHSDDVDQSFRSDVDQCGAKRRRTFSV
jgi:hypothetical protein